MVITLIDNQAKLTQNIWIRGVSLRLLAAALDTKLGAMSLQILCTLVQFKNGIWNMLDPCRDAHDDMMTG